MNEQIILLTGEKQTGKTTFLFNWCKNRNDAAGLLTPLKNGKRFFFNIETGEYFEMEKVSKEEKVFVVGKYLFSSDAFENASDRLLKSAKNQKINYLIIDEIGPLETEQKTGLFNALRIILNYPFKYLLIIVVRPSLVIDVKNILKSSNRTAEVMNINELQNYLSTSVSNVGN